MPSSLFFTWITVETSLLLLFIFSFICFVFHLWLCLSYLYSFTIRMILPKICLQNRTHILLCISLPGWSIFLLHPESIRGYQSFWHIFTPEFARLFQAFTPWFPSFFAWKSSPPLSTTETELKHPLIYEYFWTLSQPYDDTDSSVSSLKFCDSTIRTVGALDSHSVSPTHWTSYSDHVLLTFVTWKHSVKSKG